MATMGALSKVSGTAKTSPYPQTEGMLAETMTKFGQRLGENSDLAKVGCVLFNNFIISRLYSMLEKHIGKWLTSNIKWKIT